MSQRAATAAVDGEGEVARLPRALPDKAQGAPGLMAASVWMTPWMGRPLTD